MESVKPGTIVTHPEEILRTLQIRPEQKEDREVRQMISRFEREVLPMLTPAWGYQVVDVPTGGETGRIYCAVTLGSVISEALGNFNEAGRLWESVVLDALADQWLISLADSLFENCAALCRQNGWGISVRQMPGVKAPLAMAKVILESLDGQRGGLVYQEPGFLNPVKSLAYYYDISVGGDIPLHDEECSQCSRADCLRRKEDVPITVIYNGQTHTGAARKGAVLLEALRFTHAPDAPCDGRGICKACAVEIQTDSGERQTVLACRYLVQEPLRVWVPEHSQWQITEQPDRVLKPEIPLVRLESADGYIQRNWVAGRADFQALKALQALGCETTGFRFRVRDGRITGIADEGEGLHGIAIDLGTTTIAMVPVDLQTGVCGESRLLPNPLRTYGADLISRLNDPGRMAELTRALRLRIGQVLEEISRSGPPDEICVVGNNGMVQLMLGLDCTGLTRAPYSHWMNAQVEVAAGELWNGMTGSVTVLPGVSPFVGGDLIAGLAQCGIAETEEKTLYLDLGTNGEMALGNRHRLLVTSAAAGPAFEQTGTTAGSGAVKGAVKKLRCLGPGRWQAETIGGGIPIGLCGSGLIDLVAELLKYGFMDPDGTLDEAYEEGVQIAEGLLVRQSDIRAFQLAKGAVRAGVECLMDRMGWTAAELDRIVIAGGFSRDVSIGNLLSSGLVPPVDRERIVLVGNSALAGALNFLLNKNARNGVNKMMGYAEAISLAEESGFEKRFLQFMDFRG